MGRRAGLLGLMVLGLGRVSVRIHSVSSGQVIIALSLGSWMVEGD